ncbi:hypothetical protein BN14_03091 [Rhizoctonia solani AG-1 IB]|uniref:Uncharacterized protein n=1 Tax=Thanatephorus cucumeris (strain AG1-IB / isolate 7/3/14) TaxID=1108050 RepID=M5BPM8_THACB|nr:hypothetical protein BN14_03091 [Rhizoctonia solani AG-1 IB]
MLGGRSPVVASLAHELAAAVMSEPSDSRALADELGLEFEEEEEDEEEMVAGQGLGIEFGEPEPEAMLGMDNHSATIMVETPSRPSRSDMLNGHSHTHGLDLDSEFESSPSKPLRAPSFALSAATVDPIETLKENVLFLDQFIVQLKNMDVDSTPLKPAHSTNSGRLSSIYPNAEPAVERFATDIIRHIDEACREREDQLRDLMTYEREFRKIDSEPGGADRIGSVEPLEDVVLTDKPAAQPTYSVRALDSVAEDDYDDNWEAQQRDPRDFFDEDGDGDDPMFVRRSPRGSPYRRTSRRTSLPPPPPYPSDPLTPSSTLPHLAHMRTVSQVLATSLSGLSEHVQVNGAAAAEAGRKLRSLKNRVTDLQSEWASAEQSIERIEKSERGLDWDAGNIVPIEEGKRIDGRAVVKEISASFLAKLQQVELKVQAMFPKVS